MSDNSSSEKRSTDIRETVQQEDRKRSRIHSRSVSSGELGCNNRLLYAPIRTASCPESEKSAVFEAAFREEKTHPDVTIVHGAVMALNDAKHQEL